MSSATVEKWGKKKMRKRKNPEKKSNKMKAEACDSVWLSQSTLI
jgi:hypothetical protein